MNSIESLGYDREALMAQHASATTLVKELQKRLEEVEERERQNAIRRRLQLRIDVAQHNLGDS